MGTWTNKKCSECGKLMTDERWLINNGRCNICGPIKPKGELPDCPMCKGRLRYVTMKTAFKKWTMISCDFCQVLWKDKNDVKVEVVNKQYVKQ